MATSRKNAKAELSGETSTPRTPVSLSQAGFKVVKQITLPTLTIKKQGDFLVLHFEELMRVSKVQTKSADGTAQKPATVVNVTDVLTGEMGQYIVPTVVEKNLTENYPDGGYVGKTFHIEHRGKRKDGQRYNDFSIAEVKQE